jgi:predicted choloylglycine hydrolase
MAQAVQASARRTTMPSIQSYCLTLTGTPYENGKAKGQLILSDEALLTNLTERLRWFDTYGKEAFDAENAARCEQQAVERLPSLFDEIRGFTDVLQLPYERYLYYFLFDWEIPSHCSQFSILPDITQDQKVYSGHSWEWTMKAGQGNGRQTLEEDSIHVISRTGERSYMGFALNYFGLWHGMNGRGVSVNPTGVMLSGSPVGKKLHSHGLLVRIILETCQSAEEALEVIHEFVPLSRGGGGGTLIVTDVSGTSYYIERARDAIGCLAVGGDSNHRYQCATNHFVIPHMIPHMSKRGVHSVVRRNAMNAWIEAHVPRVTMETLLEMQKQPFPDGPCCHYYSSYLGTVRSMVYDLTDLKAMVSYGSPRLNPWHAYDFDIHTTKMNTVTAAFTNEEADPKIWRHIPPDEEYRQ